ncbi:hypothetical protein PDIG_39720 [Penicillium digitatum PHI26]|uniref:Uncharacterized protein n=2 Tax=Penicillium digitatum TaxID=36651 RepID=K9GEB9_PEND2|nr:hypothetical protein PDIP_25260 [Penicillium digitatum Pd1]EKV13158.1 hypothetical protein PDIG_39720 [Penicillium digitatum PHI26]EKV18928.1 hypothetical protein PDIP_25260 [Penicillium digitatum Pd1]
MHATNLCCNLTPNVPMDLHYNEVSDADFTAI